MGNDRACCIVGVIWLARPSHWAKLEGLSLVAGSEVEARVDLNRRVLSVVPREPMTKRREDDADRRTKFKGTLDMIMYAGNSLQCNDDAKY